MLSNEITLPVDLSATEKEPVGVRCVKQHVTEAWSTGPQATPCPVVNSTGKREVALDLIFADR